MITFIYDSLSVSIDTANKGENSRIFNAYIKDVVERSEDAFARLVQIFKDFGITGKDEMLKFIKHPETFELNNDLREFLLYLHDMLFSPDEDNSIKGAGVLIYAHLCICLACPDDFLFFSFYLRDLWKKRKKGDETPVIVIDEADALEFNKRVLNQHNEPEEKPAEQKCVVSFEFYDILDGLEASEKTKRIAEFFACSFKQRMLDIKKKLPDLTKEKQNIFLLRGGEWTLSADLCAPVVFTPRELAKTLYPGQFIKEGQIKTTLRALRDFAPLNNATIFRDVIDEATQRTVKRVTPIFTIEYDFKDGTADDIIKTFQGNPAFFLEKRADVLDYLQNIRVFASVPMVAHQYLSVTNGGAWHENVFQEKNENKTTGARRLARYDVPVVLAEKILKVDEMSARTQRSTKAQNELYEGIAELVRVYGKQYEYKPQKRAFCSLMQTKPTSTKRKGRKQAQSQEKNQGKGG